ncbi:hypothetical protein OIU34_30170 [Pararhizobium sp. BT-229]|uniref:hypothetical protein n=1 Tax=Pararhizobium sp. BT-229 TaxID=2986923 RepID=UPI0021F6A1FF|nr:hypothetical protein [Pararhizobium sp. BT-229]MCV9966141.1 hypothetical protein [Pararhizobium sp. BT-229]
MTGGVQTTTDASLPIPLYIAVEKFSPSEGQGWDDYIAWSGLAQLDEVVTLDGMICPFVLEEIKDSYWDHIVKEDGMLNFFTNFDFFMKELGTAQNANVLGVLRNPTLEAVQQGLGDRFRFVGYDLLDQDHSISALTNCGGFPEVFDNAELSTKGLLTDYDRAKEIQRDLRRLHPEERHADCNIWAIFRMISA